VERNRSKAEEVQCCYSVVTVRLQCGYSVGSVLLQSDYIVVSVLLQCCYSVDTVLLQWGPSWNATAQRLKRYTAATRVRSAGVEKLMQHHCSTTVTPL
jgi:hypothetical protein